MDSRAQKQLEADLLKMLAEGFPGLTVEIAKSDRWNRVAATFRWDGFEGLLPEERFHRLVQEIPESFRDERMPGLVWLELAPGETVDQFLKLPRSEDIEKRESKVYSELVDAKFFAGLKKALGPAPQSACGGDFAEAVDILSEKKFSPTRIRDAKLVFIRHAAYCDCQLIQSVEPALAKLYAKSMAT